MAAAADVLSVTPGAKQSKMAALMSQEDMEEEQRLVSWLIGSLHANTDPGAVITLFSPAWTGRLHRAADWLLKAF